MTTEPAAVKVGFIACEGAEAIDIAAPWAVFDHARRPGTGSPAFRVDLVGAGGGPMKLSNGLTVVPDLPLAEAEGLDIVVVPAMPSEAVTSSLLEGLSRMRERDPLLLSICNGAFVLARAGFLDGRSATCHHLSYGLFAARHADVRLVRRVAYVDDGDIATSAGLLSGIDLALHVVERFVGREAAQQTADDLEHAGNGWKDPADYAFGASTPRGPHVDPVCEQEVDPEDALSMVWDSATVLFCCEECLELFRDAPHRFDVARTPADRPGS